MRSAASAGASTKAAAVGFQVSKASAFAYASPDFSGPKAKIVGEGKTAVYKPTALTMAEDTSGGDCNPFVSNAKIVNKGSETAYVTFDGSPFGRVAGTYCNGPVRLRVRGRSPACPWSLEQEKHQDFRLDADDHHIRLGAASLQVETPLLCSKACPNSVPTIGPQCVPISPIFSLGGLSCVLTRTKRDRKGPGGT